MKLYVNELQENWICNRIKSEFLKAHLGASDDYLVGDPSEADTLWLLFGWGWMEIPPYYLESRKVILTVHHIDPSKINISEFLIRDNFVDIYHVPNSKVIQNFPKEINRDKIKVLPYWYDKDSWRPWEDRHIPNDREFFNIGSFQRDTEGFDLCTPKLSKGPDLFCDIVEEIHKQYKKCKVSLSGNRRQYVMSRLDKAGIEYSYNEMVSMKEMNHMYNFLDLYLVTSRHEGGPQSILESAATRTPILSTNVGMADQVLHKDCIIEFNPKNFVEEVKKDRLESKVDYNFSNVSNFELKILYPRYIELLKS
tara:strand:+ start:4481 stop:5407 length:927 start_codon:yes stop_codon:yes gene_type:complete